MDKFDSGPGGGDSRPAYIFREHTADAMFQAFGKSLEEAFQNAALALISLMWDRLRVKPEETLSKQFSGKDLPRLLVDFLEEILRRPALPFLLGLLFVPGPAGLRWYFLSLIKCS